MIKGEGMFLLPPAPDRCQVCAVRHAPEEPHNAQSLFYQTRFHMEHGRSANWLDAMAHCSDETKQKWAAALIDFGVDVNGGGVNPSDVTTAQ